MTARAAAQADWSLRLAKPADADAMPAIELAAGQLFKGDPDLSEIDFEETWEPDELRELIAKGHCLVAEHNDSIVGFLVTKPYGRELHIWEVSVDPAHQQRGIGAGLIRACMIDARNAGFAALTLTTFKDIAWNGPFYERLGFEQITDSKAHPRLAQLLEEEISGGLPADRRIAMIRFIS